jgi:hypothetical protein
VGICASALHLAQQKQVHLAAQRAFLHLVHGIGQQTFN